MARRSNKYARAARPINTGHYTTRRQLASGSYLVRRVSGGSATKQYRCPGCQQPILPGTSHVVAWPEDSGWGIGQGVAERRHWHTYCWERHA